MAILLNLVKSCIRTGVGRFGEAMKRRGLKSTSECECGAPNQSVQHIMDDCTMHRPPNGERGLTDLDEDTRIWLASTSLEIWQLTHARSSIVFSIPQASCLHYVIYYFGVITTFYSSSTAQHYIVSKQYTPRGWSLMIRPITHSIMSNR